MIDINDITVRIGSKVLLEHASAHLADGWKIGLVGANGCGKTTLFRVLHDGLDTESGNIGFPTSQKMVTVEQELRDLELPILRFVLSRDSEREELLARLEQASEFELAELHERLNVIGAASAEARASSILNGLGFSAEDLSRPIREFSGGWRMRLALAAALFQPSDILLLDEPTNHLDLEASLWLENHLQKYRGTLLLISHDRNILNAVCTHIIHIEGLRLNSYTGNYDTFQRTRAEKRLLLSKQAEKQEKQRRHLQSFVDRFRYKASKAKQAQSRIKMLEKLEALPALDEESNTNFDFPTPRELPSPLLSVEEGTAGYGDKVVLRKLNFTLCADDRIALIGANGNGKSTLAKVLSGRLPLLSGQLKTSGKLKVGYFAQHQAEELPLDETAVEFMARLFPGRLEPQVRAHLARFGLDREKALTEISRLSGGEKARLLFAAMTVEAPQLLILDEPTNHLDIDGRDALIAALNEYNGAVILITHDLHLIELIADNLWLVKDGAARAYNGDLKDYQALLLGAENKPQQVINEKSSAKAGREESLARRSELNRLNSRLARIEKEMASFQERRSAIEKEFAENPPVARIIELQKDLSWNTNALAAAEEEWLEVSARIGELS